MSDERDWLVLLDERLNMKVFRIEYDCECWYLFNVNEEHRWKIIDFVICDEHMEKYHSSASTRNKEEN